jgi:hypothetical protein
MDNEDFVVGCLAGCFISTLVLFFIFFGCVGTFNDGYKQAYIDMKQGKVEAYMMDHYSKVWVEQNVNKTDYIQRKMPETGEQ